MTQPIIIHYMLQSLLSRYVCSFPVVEIIRLFAKSLVKKKKKTKQATEDRIGCILGHSGSDMMY